MISKIKSYFRRKGFYEYRRGWDKGTCLFCGSEDKAGVNYSRNFYHCFKCEEKSTAKEAILTYEDVDFNGLKNILKNLEDLPVKLEVKVKRPEIPEIILPDHFISLHRGTGELADRARDYVYNKRGIDPRKARRMGLGYVYEPTNTYFGSVIFPYKMGGSIIYFQGRRFLKLEPRFLNPDQDKVGRGKAKTIYNIDILNVTKDVDIMESTFNVLTVDHPAVGINGKAISPWQFTQLMRSEVEIFNIMLDSDAWEYARELARKLLPQKKIRLIKFPEGIDVNDLGNDKVKAMRDKAPIIKSRIHLDKYTKELNVSDNKTRRVRVSL